ncbi:MAG: hypothetical protein ACRDRW_18855 [Pseudonocardiaceae bacterium]
MPDSHIAVAREADRYAAHRMAAAAAAKAKRLWPDVIGEVLADEIMALLDLPSWLRPQTRTQQLINAILNTPEGAAKPRDDDRPRATATPNAGASHAA